MSRCRHWRVAVPLALALAVSAARAADPAPHDLYFSEALYHARQGEWFEALQRLDTELGQHYGLDEPKLDSLYPLIGDAEFSVGDFELNYRMHHRAGRAIKAVLEGDVPERVRNDAAYRLARIHFQKGQLVDALHALDRIRGEIPNRIRDDVEFLRANVYLATARPDDAAPILKKLQGAKDLRGFSEYNLAIAYLQEERRDDALAQLAKAGTVDASDEQTRAIRDKANLVRGTLLLEAGAYADAKGSLEQVRLDGPYSNQALLSAGWAEFSAKRVEGALVPWNILVRRDHTDPAVQEALLALPYAYGELAVHGRAAYMYSQALQAFGTELDKLDASIVSIREGKFLEALVREEIRQDKDWVVRLRSLPEAPETYYLVDLLASHDFQTALQNYLDLEDLRKRLSTWQRNFDAFEDMVAVRRAYYEPRLPDIDQNFREADSGRRVRLEQHKLLRKRMQQLLIAPRPEHLATTAERQLMARFDEIDQEIGDGTSGEEAALRERLARLRGVVMFGVKTEYHERLTRFYEHLEEASRAIDVLEAQYAAFVRTRQAAMHSYVGYEIPIRRLRTRVADAITRTDRLMARQGTVLERVAVRELQARVRRLEGYEERARYALADSYDRATKAQNGIEGE